MDLESVYSGTPRTSVEHSFMQDSMKMALYNYTKQLNARKSGQQLESKRGRQQPARQSRLSKRILQEAECTTINDEKPIRYFRGSQGRVMQFALVNQGVNG
eukprot:988853-Amphidinium_carterae.6